jgi:hypothetical protein
MQNDTCTCIHVSQVDIFESQRYDEKGGKLLLVNECEGVEAHYLSMRAYDEAQTSDFIR